MTIISKKNWNPWENCQSYALKLFWNAFLGTNWTTWFSMVSEQTCTINHKMDQSLWQTIMSFDLLHSSYMWLQQYCHVRNTAKQCRLGLFQDSDFAGDLEDSKSTSGGTLWVFGSHTFVPISWMFKKQTSVSHSSTESEIISLDAGWRLDGITALDLWDLIVAVLGNTNQSHKEQDDPLMNKREVRSTYHTIQKRKQSQGVINDLHNVDFIPLKRQLFSSGSFVVCVWRQRSSDQDDHEGKKPYSETCFQNPQSCSWLVVR